MTNLKPHEQDRLRYLLNAFAAAAPSVQTEALRSLNAQARRQQRETSKGLNA